MVQISRRHQMARENENFRHKARPSGRRRKITNLAAISLRLNVGKQLTAGDFGGKKNEIKWRPPSCSRLCFRAAHNRHESLQFLAARCFRRRCRSASVGRGGRSAIFLSGTCSFLLFPPPRPFVFCFFFLLPLSPNLWRIIWLTFQ